MKKNASLMFIVKQVTNAYRMRLCWQVADYGLINKGWLCMFPACEVWCIADAPSEQTKSYFKIF